MKQDTETNVELSELEHDVEYSILDDIRLLDMDRGSAVKELMLHCDSLGRSFEDLVEGTAEHLRDDLKKIQLRLGELNYLLAEENIDDLSLVNNLRDRILTALGEAEVHLNQTLEKLKNVGAKCETHIRLFRERIELVRIHLLHDVDTISQRFDQIRKEIEAAKSSPEEVATKSLHAYLTEFREDAGHYLKAFFQDPDEGCRPESWDHD